MTKGLGQYDLEYARCSCFWGTEPGKYVRILASHLTGGNALDLGAGEGKNAIYLASLGFNVVAVECSDYALRNFRTRLNKEPHSVTERVHVVQANVIDYVPSNHFDVIIAYGLLHCLPSHSAAKNTVTMMQANTLEGGYNVVVTFTNSLPVPDVHRYLEPTLLDVGELEGWYSPWHLVHCENQVIEEVHPTTKVPHKHSLCRLMAQKL